MARGTPEAVDRYQVRRTAASVVEEKTQAWEEFREATEKDFQAVLKMFRQTVRRLRRKRISPDRELLTRTGYIAGRLKEHFEELPKPTNSPSIEEAKLVS